MNFLSSNSLRFICLNFPSLRHAFAFNKYRRHRFRFGPRMFGTGIELPDEDFCGLVTNFKGLQVNRCAFGYGLTGAIIIDANN